MLPGISLLTTHYRDISVMQNNVYHEGELAMQTRANVSDLANRTARAIANHIPERAIPFIEQQAMFVIGSMDTEGQVWTSVIFGQPGFITAYK